jgi:Uma2 family endonuclease
MTEQDPRYLIAAGPGTLTYEDYCALPEDGLRYEVIDGFLYSEPSPWRVHQTTLGNLLLILHTHVRERDLGDVFTRFDVILDPRTVVVPDLVFVARERAGIVTERAVEGAPDLIVEILSLGTTRRDRVAKSNAYARHGVRHYWLVDPEAKTLEARELIEGAYRVLAALAEEEDFRPVLFHELTISLRELWD